MYKITATIEKAGNAPTQWTRFSTSKMTKTQCEKIFSGKTEAGISRKETVTIKYFKCIKTT